MSVKWNARLSDELADEIDAIARERKTTRTAVMVDAMKVYVEWRKQPVGLPVTPVTVTSCGADLRKPAVVELITSMAEAAVKKHLVAPAEDVSDATPRKQGDGDCPTCSTPLIVWGPTAVRCVRCKRNYAREEVG